MAAYTDKEMKNICNTNIDMNIDKYRKLVQNYLKLVSKKIKSCYHID